MDRGDDTEQVSGGLPGRLLASMDVDRAVFYSVMLRCWQLPAGLVSALLITQFFTGDVQGYYYTFASLTAMQTFFELNMFLVVINVSSHEWSRLRLGKEGAPEGDNESLSRLVSFGRQLFVWYGGAAVAYILLVGAFGWYFFRSEPQTEVVWREPWILVVVINALLMWCLPFNSMLEGCNQVATVNKFRLVQAMLANVVVWGCLAGGLMLWTAVAAVAARLICELVFLGVRFRAFFRPFLRRVHGPRISWRREVWPMQWRLGISGVFSYFAFFLFTPVLFKYHGAEVAGQMGMTWAIMTAIQAAALSWVQTKAPRFGMLIADRKYQQLDSLFRRLFLRSMLALIVAAATVWSMILALNHWELAIKDRLLDPWATGVFLLAIIFYQVPSCLAIYLRAHKREPFLVANLVFCASVGLVVWLCGQRFGPLGVATGYLLVVALYMLPHYSIIWWRCRRRWHTAGADGEFT